MKRTLFIACLALGFWVSANAEPVAWEADCGSTVTITADSKDGYAFDHWSDGSTSVSREIEVNAENAAITYIAIFKKDGGTGMDNTQNAPVARKVLIDNQLYIAIGDQLFDATGKRVR